MAVSLKGLKVSGCVEAALNIMIVGGKGTVGSKTVRMLTASGFAPRVMLRVEASHA